MKRKIQKSKKALRRSMVHITLAAMSMGGGVGMARAQTQPAGSVSAPVKQPTWAERTAHDKRFQDSVDAFVSLDREHAPKPGGIVFVGSSTIRFWETLGEQFEDLPIVRRGFGGSRMADVAQYADSLVTPYKPKMVVVYAGDNDINEGASPQDVFTSFKQFVEKVRYVLPDTRIAYVSIKPSPSRAQFMSEFCETNALIKDYTQHMSNMDYIDTYSAMLDPEGEPRRDLFLADMLHMNSKGYALWRQVVRPHLENVPVTASGSTAPRTVRVKSGPVSERETRVQPRT